jgi:hypothetical protein
MKAAGGSFHSAMLGCKVWRDEILGRARELPMDWLACELCKNWLNPPDLVRIEPEIVSGYPAIRTALYKRTRIGRKNCASAR